MLFTLRIKKLYFEQIRSKIKQFEYRSIKPYYRNLEQATALALHYQKGVWLIVEVKSIRVIPLPEHLKKSLIKFTDFVYEIKLGEVLS